jgi:hypothetical protein
MGGFFFVGFSFFVALFFSTDLPIMVPNYQLERLASMLTRAGALLGHTRV